jgi:hypothetical protein
MWFRVRFVLLIGMGVVLVLAGCAQAVQLRGQAAFQHAFATNTCAPWDGAATRIVLQQQPVKLSRNPDNGPKATYPNISIDLWLHQPPLNQWISLSDNNGSESACSSQAACQTHKSRIRFSAFTQNIIKGELREALEDGTNRELVYPFKATVYPVRMFCG